MQILQEVLSSSACKGWFSTFKICGTFHYDKTVCGSLRVTDEGGFDDIFPLLFKKNKQTCTLFFVFLIM